MVKAARGYVPQAAEQRSAADFGLSDRLSDLESQLSQTRAELAEANATTRRYDLRQGVVDEQAYESQDAVREQSTKLIAQLEAGGIRSGSEYERLAQMAETGASYQEKTVANRLVGLLDVPFRAIRSSLLDFTQLDKKLFGTEIDSSDNLKDIILQRDDSLRRRNKAFTDSDAKWSDDIFNISKLMEEAGYKKADSMPGKFVRGAAQFGIEMVGDPINWFTGGLAGIGKGTARASGKAILSGGVEAAARKVFRGSTDEVLDSMASFAAKRLEDSKHVIDDAVDKAAKEGLDKAGQDAAREAAERNLRDAIEEEMEREVMQPLLKKDFAGLPEWWQKSQRVVDNNPALLGGVRPTLPMGSGIKGARPLPGTVGAGRKITRTLLGTRKGTEAKGFLGQVDEAGTGFGKLFDEKLTAFDSWASKFSNTQHAWRAARRGDVGVANWIEDGLVRAKTDLGLRDLQPAIAARENRVLKALAGLAPDEMAEVDRSFLNAVQTGAFKADGEDIAWPVFLADEQVEALSDFGRFYDDTFRDFKSKAANLGIDLGPHENYVPFVYNTDFEKALRRLADSGASIDIDNLPEGLEEGLSWLTEALAATQRRGTKNMTSMVGETGHAQTRNMGREVSITDVDGITIFNVSDGAKVQFASHAQINDALQEAIQWLASKEGISIPKFDSALEMNPVEIMNRYTSSMGKALQERWLIREGRQVGAIRSGTFRTDLGRLAARHVEMAETAGESLAAQARIDRMEATLRGLDDELADPFKNTKNISLGPHGKVELPARAVRAKDRRLEKAVEAAQRKSKAYNLAKTTHAREVENAVERLTARGIPEGEARLMAESTSRRELKQVARRSRDLALDEAREEIGDVMDAARRLEIEASEWEAAYRSALKASEKAEKAAVRSAQKAQDKLNKQVALSARKDAEGSFPRMRFDGEEEAAALVDTMRLDLNDVLDDLAADIGDESFEAAVEALKDKLQLGDWDEIGAALNEFLGVGRRVRQASDTLTDAEIELMSGPVMDVLRKANDLDLIGEDTWKKVTKAGLRPGQEDETGRLLWDWLAATVTDVSNQYGAMYRNAQQNGMTPGIRAHLKSIDEVLDQLHKAKDITLGRLESAPRQARIDQILQGSPLRGELNALRKLALGQKVMSDVEARQGLERLLQRAGMIGPEIALEAAPSSRFGFELVDRSGFELPPAATDLVDRAIAEGARARRFDPEINYLGSEADRAVAEARVTSKLRKEVLTPLTNKTSTMADLETAYKTFKGMKPQLRATLAPLDRVDIDLVGQHLEKVIALKRAAEGSPELLRAVDSANNLRTLYFDPDTTIESLTNLGRDVAQDIIASDRSEVQGALALVEKMDETLRQILGLTRTPDGLVRRGFATPEEEEMITQMLAEGKAAWRKLGLPESVQPFHRVETPTIQLPNFVSVKGELEGVIGKGEVVQIDAAAWLKNTMAVQLGATTPEGMKELSNGMRAVMKIWKAQATVARPTFHIRNFIGAFWNGMMADTRVQDYQFAFSNTESFLRALKKSDTVDEALETLPEKARAAFRAAWDEGIFDDSFASTEILSNRMHRRTLNRFNPLSAEEGFVVKAGGRAMMTIESNMRMAVFARHFGSAVEAGASHRAAAQAARSWVNMVHFDYANLSQAEERARTIAPFFVWMRRNLPLQMRMILENPRFMARYDSLLSSVDGQTDDMHADDLPNSVWRQGTMYANLGTANADSPWWARVLLDVDLPVSVFDEVTMEPSSWASMFSNQLGPQFDVANLFADDSDPEYFTTAPGGISQLINMIPFDTPGAEKNPYGVPRLTPKAAAFWRMAFPAMNELGGFMFEQDPKRRASLGQAPLTAVDGDDDWLSEAGAFAALMARGLGVQLESAGDAYANVSKAQYGDLPLLKQELRRTGKITPEAEAAVEQADKEKALLAALQELRGPIDLTDFDSGS